MSRREYAYQGYIVPARLTGIGFLILWLAYFATLILLKNVGGNILWSIVMVVIVRMLEESNCM